MLHFSPEYCYCERYCSLCFICDDSQPWNVLGVGYF